MGKKSKPTQEPKYQLPEINDTDQASAIEAHPEVLQVVGEIVARWSLVELQLTITLSFLVNDLHAADIILNSLGSFKAKVDVVRNSVTELVPDGPEKEEIKWLLDKIQDASSVRNDIVHGLWGVQGGAGGTPVRHIRRPGTKLPIQVSPISKRQLKDHSNRVAALMSRLSQLNHPMPHLLQQRGT